MKNEAHVLQRLLENVGPYVDFALICDTGSTDDSPNIARRHLENIGLPGVVVQSKWRDFATNRTEALEKLRGYRHIDYALMMDADDLIQTDGIFDLAAFKAGLTHDHYYFEIRSSGATYKRPHLCKNNLPYRYRGVLHEFLVLPEHATSSDIRGLYIDSRREGARSADPDKYQKDAAILETALANETDEFLRSRYLFYLAQSYWDAKNFQASLINYEARAALGFWQEEVFQSKLRIAGIRERLGAPFEDVLKAYLEAAASSATRAEAHHSAARFCRINNQFERGYQIAREALSRPYPPGGLFVETWIYDFGLLDEFSINAYWCGRYREALDASALIFFKARFPEAQRERLAANAMFALKKASEIFGESKALS